MRQIINTKTKPRWSSARMTNLRHLRTQACNVGHHGRVQSREFDTGFRAHARTERAMLGRHRTPYLVSYMCSQPATKSPTRITRKAVHLLCSLPSTSAAAVLSTPPTKGVLSDRMSESDFAARCTPCERSRLYLANTMLCVAARTLAEALQVLSGPITIYAVVPYRVRY
jgi:hypothetical protein